MKDWLKTFDEDVTKEIIGMPSSTIILVKVKHNPTGIFSKQESRNLSPQELLYILLSDLKKKVKAHYEQEELKRAEEQEPHSFACGCYSCTLKLANELQESLKNRE